ncbi:hypothetical protein [Lichenibacterium ramalinae]|uniref:hypothetical protein n=1 Tax=Lichenibacterium ramalinae TaxID=2316527 RepID=UPI00100E40BF|nr:hypothetical protein [Lichenibacterium ramalinae]
MVANEHDVSEKKHDPGPTFEAGAGHVPVPDPVEKQPVFEAGAGRGGVADHSIVSPTFEPTKDRNDEKTKGS